MRRYLITLKKTLSGLEGLRIFREVPKAWKSQLSPEQTQQRLGSSIERANEDNKNIPRVSKEVWKVIRSAGGSIE